MNSPATLGTRRRLALLFGVPLAFFVVFYVLNLLAEANDLRVAQVRNLTSAIARLRADAYESEMGEHGFLLTGSESYLLILENATNRLDQDVTALHGSWDIGLPDLRRDADVFQRAVAGRVAQANEVIRKQRSSGFSPALEMLRSAHSEELMLRVRDSWNSMQRALAGENERLRDAERRLTHITFLLFLFGTMIMLVVLVWLYNSFLSYMQARDAANAELQALNSELEKRIEERTRELQEFNEELQQFAYVASHDLQEPLRTVTSFTQLLASRYKGTLDEDADEFMGYIVASAKRMTDLINGLLALVRLRKAGGPKAPIPLGKLLEEAEVSLQAAIRETGARIEVSDLPSLMVDAVQLTQVLQNLISNAIKYRRDEAPVIRVAARRDATNWVISVEDNGRGFDPRYAERIFGLFQRLHTRDVEGTGMGLTIVRKIIERHGGRIWAESHEGVGTTFFFTLPVSLEAHAAADRFEGSRVSDPTDAETGVTRAAR